MAILPLILHYRRIDLTNHLCAQLPDATVIDAMGDYRGPNRTVVIKNRGFTANWNAAIASVWDEPWDHIALLNNDITFQTPRPFDVLGPLLDGDPELGIASPCFNSPWASCNCVTGQGPVATEGVEFTAPILKRDVLARLGKFDEAITLGFGVDVYYCHLAQKLGYKIVVDHRVSFHHVSNASGAIEFGTARRYLDLGYKELYEIALKKIVNVTRTQVIQRLIDCRRFRTYLEIGYGDGGNFEAIAVDVKHAVDPHVTGRPAVTAKSSDRFFEEAAAVEAKYDLIFIDGLHTFDQVMHDYEGALRCLKPGGCILLHDVNPTGPEHVRSQAEFQAEGGEWTGDAYKAWAAIRRSTPFHTATILDDFGIGIIDSSRSNEGVTIAPPADWEDFKAHRRRFLNPILFDEIR